MSGDVTVMGFQKEYPVLNLKCKKEDERKFEYGLVYLAIKECERGFKIKRINKTTRKGTKITYEAIEGREDLEKYMKELESKAREFNKKYGEGFILHGEQTK